MKQLELVSIRAYAAGLGINEAAVRKAIKEKKIKKGFDNSAKKINPEIADKEWGHLHKVVKPRPGQSMVKMVQKIEAQQPAVQEPKAAKKTPKDPTPPPVDDEEVSPDDEMISSMKITKNMSLQEVVRRKALIEAAMEKRKLQELEGVLVRREVVEKSLFALGVEFRKSLLNIPARITADVRGAKTEVEAQTVITMEINQVLNHYANLQEIKL